MGFLPLAYDRPTPEHSAGTTHATRSSHPSPARLVRATNPAMLLRLPLELRRMVVEELRLPRLPLGTPRSLNADFIGSRSALLGLCLTSRHFYELAEPLLYETVALTEDKQFVHLLNALLAKRDRRLWIHSLACPMSIMSETDNLAALPVWNRLIAPRKDSDLDFPEQAALFFVELEVGHIIREDQWDTDEFGDGSSQFCDQLLAVVLCLTTNLEDILLQVPTDQEPHLDDYLPNLAHALCLGRRGHRSRVLKSLRSVRAQPTRFVECESYNSEIRPRNVVPGRFDPAFGIDPICLHAFEMQNIEAIEYCGDNGTWFKLLKPDHGPWTDDTLPLDLRGLRSLKSLKLYESRTTPSYLRHLLEQAHSLEAFHYTTRQQEWTQDYSNDRYAGYAFMPRDFFSINEALDPIKNTVKELTLGSVQRSWDNGDQEYRDLELIVVLDSFERLTHLSIDVRWLIPISLDMDEEVAIVPLCKRLPRSIKDIKLTETWTRRDLRALSSSSRLEKRAMAWVQAALWTLLVVDDEAGGKEMKLSHLRKVTLAAVPTFHSFGAGAVGSDEEDDDGDFDCAPLKTDQGIEEMKSAFAMHGVGFHVEWMCDHLFFSPSGEDSESDEDPDEFG